MSTESAGFPDGLNMEYKRKRVPSVVPQFAAGHTRCYQPGQRRLWVQRVDRKLGLGHSVFGVFTYYEQK